MAKKKILILFAHPALPRSNVNRALLRAASKVDGVTVLDLYAEYPNFAIHIDLEQQRLREHDVVIFCFPLLWYSTPSILKEYQDLVLEYGFAYGEGGVEMRGKTFLASTTAAAPQEAFQGEGYNHHSMRELFAPLEQMASLCQMDYLPPFALFGALSANKYGKIWPHVRDWLELLTALRDGRLDIKAARDLPLLNQDLSALIKKG